MQGGLVDIHCHILPGIDDGATDAEMSRAMLEAEASEGVRTVILTPHHKPGHRNAPPQVIRRMTDELQAYARQAGLGLRLCPGNEIYYSSETTEQLLQGSVLTLADSDCVLIEFGPMEARVRIRNALLELQTAGFQPILAHVERYSELARHPEALPELADMGVLLQVNARSIAGRNGLGIRGFTRGLLRDGLVHFVATDAHDMERRAPRLRDCAGYITAKLDEQSAARVLYRNADELIFNGKERGQGQTDSQSE